MTEGYTLIGGPKHGTRVAVQPGSGPYIVYGLAPDLSAIDWKKTSEVNEPVAFRKVYYEKGVANLAFYAGTK